MVDVLEATIGLAVDTRRAKDIKPFHFTLPLLDWFIENASKNNESYLGDVKEEDDTDERCRVRINIVDCFFGGDECNNKLWAIDATWTMSKDYRQCLLYAMHHATQSGAHGLTHREAYDIIATFFL